MSIVIVQSCGTVLANIETLSQVNDPERVRLNNNFVYMPPENEDTLEDLFWHHITEFEDMEHVEHELELLMDVEDYDRPEWEDLPWELE